MEICNTPEPTLEVTQNANDGCSEHDMGFLEKELQETFTVNVIGVVKTITAFLPLIKKGKSKKIITLSTGMADLGMFQSVISVRRDLANQSKISSTNIK